MHPHRRALLMGLLLPALAPTARALPARTLVFPRDHGAHPELRTEWWYITGHASAGEGSARRAFGFQVTFFRSRVDGTESLRSAFAARQLLFAHAAVTDVAGRRLLHDQRIAREGFGIAQADTRDAALKLGDWSLSRHDPQGAVPERWRARVQAGDFTFDLRFDATQPLLLQGRSGLSRKGPEEKQASYYYSQPQLAVQGRLATGGTPLEVAGRAWLDHEWSEELLHPDAVGWDWIGMNLDDGGALTAFRLRTRDGGTLWAGGSLRAADGRLRIFDAAEVAFEPGRRWRSPASRADYPVQWRVRTPAGSFTVDALLDDQELDSRGSTGAIYWEGLSELRDETGRSVGRGYLEMTGYASALRL